MIIDCQKKRNLHAQVEDFILESFQLFGTQQEELSQFERINLIEIEFFFFALFRSPEIL